MYSSSMVGPSLKSLKQKMDEMERASAAALSVSTSRTAELEASNDMLQTRIAELEPELVVIRSQAARKVPWTTSG